MARVAQLGPLVQQLLDIKKNRNLTDVPKNEATTNWANDNASVLGGGTAEIGCIILDLQTDVNLEMQSYFNLSNQNQ